MKITTEMARYIWSIIAANPSLSMSWGVDTDSFVCSDDAFSIYRVSFI